MSVWFKLPVNEAVPMERRLGTADAVVIGTRIIQLIENQPHEKVVALVSDFLRGIRKALDA